jgi:hypothetical protein
MKQNKMVLFALAGLWVAVSGATEYGSSGCTAPLFSRSCSDAALSTGETIFLITSEDATAETGKVSLCSFSGDTDGIRTDTGILTLHCFTDGTPGASAGTGEGTAQSLGILPAGTAYRSYSDWTGDRSVDRAVKTSRTFSVWPGTRSSGLHGNPSRRFSGLPGGTRPHAFRSVDL